MARGFPRGSIYEQGVSVWSPNRLGYLVHCPRKFYFGYVAKEKVSYNVPLVVGILLHSKVEKFFNKKGEPAFKSPEKFAKAALGSKDSPGSWLHIMDQGNIQGNVIDWGDKKPWIVWDYTVRPILESLYPKLVEEGPPLLTEYPFAFILEERAFTGVIDSIRRDKNGDLFLRDFKSGRYSSDVSKMFPQFTTYGVAHGVLCYMDEKYRRALDITEREARELAGNPHYIPPNLKYEVFRLHDDEPEGKTLGCMGYAKKRLGELGLENLAERQLEVKEDFEKTIEEEASKLEMSVPETIIPLEITHEHYQDLCDWVDVATFNEIFMREKMFFPANRSPMCPSCQFYEPCQRYRQDFKGHSSDNQGHQKIIDEIKHFRPRPKRSDRVQIFHARRRKRIKPAKKDRQPSLFTTPRKKKSD